MKTLPTNSFTRESIEEAIQAAPPINPPALVQQADTKTSPADWYSKLGGPRLEKMYGLLPKTLLHIIDIESKGDPNAISHKGAKGLFGIMPGPKSGFYGDPFDPMESSIFVARELSKLVRQLGSYEKALAAYNWGRGNVSRKGLHKAPKQTRDYLEFFRSKGILDPVNKGSWGEEEQVGSWGEMSGMKPR
jgi:soluble lytic murein transglycosylase-like protein